MHLLALSTLAITQPLLGILGANPTFFTAHGSSPGQIVWFALAVALVPAIVLSGAALATHMVNARLGARVHLASMSALGFLFVVQVVDALPGPWIIAVLVAAAIATGLVVAYRRHAPVRTATSVLGVSPLLFVGAFVFLSPTNAVIFPEDVTAVGLDDLIDTGTLGDGAPSQGDASETESGEDDPRETGGVGASEAGDGTEAADGADTAPPPDGLAEQIAARFPPIHILVFDELPMASLLDRSGGIDAERWPNFARLADTSHLFSNATTVGFTTERAVPALLTGSYDTAAAPVYSLYPDNLFTLLGDIYDVSSSDPLVDLCPPSICNGAPPEALLALLSEDETPRAETDRPAGTGDPEPAERSIEAGGAAATSGRETPDPHPGGRPEAGSSSLRLLLDDAAIVFGHLATPSGLDLGLPSIGAGWGNFGGDLGLRDDAEVPAPTAPPTTSRSTTTTNTTSTTTTLELPLPIPSGGVTGPPPDAETDAETDSDPVDEVDADAVNRENQEYLDRLSRPDADTRVAEMRDEIARLAGGPVPHLHYLHVLLPHVPWRLHGDGTPYADISLPGYFANWNDDPGPALASQQRHLLQLQFVDGLLGEYLDALETAGVFDDATIIVTADHGISFVAGQPARGPGQGNLGGIAAIPLLYKLPGQTTPTVHTKPVETIDVVPTIAAQLDIETPWPVDGHDLFGPVVERDRIVRYPFPSDVIEPLPPQIEAVTADLLDTFGTGDDGNLYALAGLAPLIGEPVDALGAPPDADLAARDAPVRCWSLERPTAIPEGDGSTGYVRGRLSTARTAAVDLAIVVDGTLTGTSRSFDDGTPHRVYALGDPFLWEGATVDDIELHEIVDGRLVPIPRCGTS